MTRRARCPRCHKAVLDPLSAEPENRPADYPFCSERCRLLDLSKWLQGEYSIPTNAPLDVGPMDVGTTDAGSFDSPVED
jgi:endogenous inhibitor of DNA gyrase (YacG/DUF329 family)